MAKKLTPNQAEYQKQLKNLKRRIKTVQKKGYIVPETIIPETPKRITKSDINVLKSIRSKQIISLSEKPVETSILKAFEEELNKLPETVMIRQKGIKGYFYELTPEKNVLYTMFENAVAYSPQITAQTLLDNEVRWTEAFREIMYPSSESDLHRAFSSVAAILSEAQHKIPSMEELDNVNALLEYYSDY